ncbi:PstS family phosphate ABC transporter substrate-binding protein [Lentilactobacillus parakefiri]|uniref:Phosphate ABC transporter substrate-binding protein n=1 Tax=Lentilactobacillus parakefiri TaxID=152332 RepID=A0A224V7A1_9LACO|nr:substrate-binding domain-containing protein [Lentilactobacillus parakefiri]KRL52147.1 phosphate ABC transporter substrate-binding protein [Lentilactobacillus parakefiri DSM 10551]GAW72998.1 phosphate ABC transporter substrate-binding protein [Lentilactobacillus parakefiri]
MLSPLIVGSTGVYGIFWSGWALLPAFLLNAIYWYRYNRKNQFSNYRDQIWAVLVAFIYYFGSLTIILAAAHYSYLDTAIYYPAFIFPYNFSAVAVAVGLFYHHLGWMFVGTFWSAVLGILTYQWQTHHLPKLHRIQVGGFIVIFLVSLLPLYQNFANNLKYTDTSGTSSLNLAKYQPFKNRKALATLNHPTTLQIQSKFPRLNGATALYPMYSAVAQTLYTGVSARQGSQLVKVDSTPKAFNSLLKKQSDVIFMAKPSAAQFRAAKQHHVHLKLTKIGSEAFVFFVNQHNPVDNLSLKQIQSIYQRQTIFWSSVGGKFAAIQPFQRPEGSGSQTAMEQMVMANKQMAKPLRYQEFDVMDGVIDGVAGYNNRTNAIGYSFRFFATQMMHNKQVKLLKINGVSPTAANIRNDKYPLTAHFYAITGTHPSKNSERLINWLTTNDGQALINRTGYVGLK